MPSASNQPSDAAPNGAASEMPLWEPTTADREGAEMTRFMHWAGERRGREFDGLRGSVALVGGRARGLLAEHLGVLRRALFARLRAVLAAREHARRAVVQGAELNYAENMLRGPAHDGASDRDAARSRAALLGAARARHLTLGRADARRWRASRGGSARARRRARRSRGGLHAEHPRDADCLPRDGFARARSGRARRRSSARAA